MIGLLPKLGAPAARCARISVAAAATVLVAVGLSSGVRGEDDVDRAAPDPGVFDEAWKIVRDQFYDRDFRGVDWEGARSRWQTQARSAKTRRDLHEVILRMLAELKTSHTSIVEPDVFREHVEAETKGLLVPFHGVELVELEAGYFVNDVPAGSAAAAAGVVRGDRLLKVDGSSPDEAGLRPSSWDAGLGGPRGWSLPSSRKTVVLELERRRTRDRAPGNRFDEDPKRLPSCYTVKLTARPWNLIEAMRASARTVSHGPGLSLGYVRIHHVLSEDVVDILAEMLSKGALKDADGLVLDLRGRGGMPQAADRILALFDKNARGGPVWARPAVALVDKETRSAKEILAWKWRELGVGPLVGEKTRGAVIGARYVPLRDGAYLTLANFDMRCLTGGISLEGKGVTPDVEVKDDLPYAEGRDRIRDAAWPVLLERVLARQRGSRPHGWY